MAEHNIDINWYVNFEITVNGVEVDFDQLPESTKQNITDSIRDGYISGTFGDEIDDEEPDNKYLIDRIKETLEEQED